MENKKTIENKIKLGRNRMKNKSLNMDLDFII